MTNLSSRVGQTSLLKGHIMFYNLTYDSARSTFEQGWVISIIIINFKVTRESLLSSIFNVITLI